MGFLGLVFRRSVFCKAVRFLLALAQIGRPKLEFKYLRGPEDCRSSRSLRLPTGTENISVPTRIGQSRGDCCDCRDVHTWPTRVAMETVHEPGQRELAAGRLYRTRPAARPLQRSSPRAYRRGRDDHLSSGVGPCGSKISDRRSGLQLFGLALWATGGKLRTPL